MLCMCLFLFFLCQADVVVSFGVSELEKAEVLDPSLTNPPMLCSRKGASVKGSLGPFGLIVFASKGLIEHTAVFYRVFKARDKYAVLMCSDQSRSLLICLSLRHQCLTQTSLVFELFSILFPSRLQVFLE